MPPENSLNIVKHTIKPILESNGFERSICYKMKRMNMPQVIIGKSNFSWNIATKTTWSNEWQ